jgi:hypothetical protein
VRVPRRIIEQPCRAGCHEALFLRSPVAGKGVGSCYDCVMWHETQDSTGIAFRHEVFSFPLGYGMTERNSSMIDGWAKRETRSA